MFGLSRKPQTRKHDGGEILVADRWLPFTIIEHARAKRLTLRIEPGGRGIRVTTPPKISRDEIDEFVDRHHDWLSERIVKLPDQKTLTPGMKVPIRGIPHRIVVAKQKRGLTRTDNDADGPILVVYGEERFIGRRTSDYLRKLAKAEIEPLAIERAKSIGKQIRSIRFKDTSSRWGSCSQDGNLSFSWRIMMAPPAIIDYLVAHEVAHLQEMNHSVKFWQLCEKLCPKTPDCKAWLRRNGTKLQAIPF